MAKSKKSTKAASSRKAPMQRRDTRAAAPAPAPRSTRSAGNTLNADYVGARIKQYFEKGKVGTSPAGWYKGTVVDVLANDNVRIQFDDGERHAFPKTDVLRMVKEKLFKFL